MWSNDYSVKGDDRFPWSTGNVPGDTAQNAAGRLRCQGTLLAYIPFLSASSTPGSFPQSCSPQPFHPPISFIHLRNIWIRVPSYAVIFPLARTKLKSSQATEEENCPCDWGTLPDIGLNILFFLVLSLFQPICYNIVQISEDIQMIKVVSDNQYSQRSIKLPKDLRPWQCDLYKKGANKRNSS